MTFRNNNILGGHEYVDLGLPSGRLWATCNVGANSPEEYGDYFAWGEIEPKRDYSVSSYKWCGGSIYEPTKYSIESEDADSNSVLEEDDAATANWGSAWRMPTMEEIEELMDGCDWEWTENFRGTGVAGQIGISHSNGNAIFLPAAGYRDGKELLHTVDYGSFWTSTLLEDDRANCLTYYDIADFSDESRSMGLSIRAVVK